MANLYCTIGVPASGKSTWAENLCKEDFSYSWVSRDGIRDKLVGLTEKYGTNKVPNSIYFSKETLVYQQYIQLIKDSLKMGYDTIADATLSSARGVHKFLNMINTKDKPYDKIIAVIFPISVDECKKRNAARKGWRRVPDTVIEGMHEKIVNEVVPILPKYFDIVITYKGEFIYAKDE